MFKRLNIWPALWESWVTFLPVATVVTFLPVATVVILTLQPCILFYGFAVATIINLPT